MASGIINRSYYGAAQKGREDAQAEQINRLRMVGAQQDIDQQNRLVGVMNDPNASAEQYARVGRSDIAHSLTGLDNNKRAQAHEFATQVVNATKYVNQVPPGQAKGFIEKNFPFLVETYGPEWANADDNTVRQELSGIAAKFGVQAGMTPAEPVKQFTTEKGPRGSVIQVDPVTGERKQVVGPDNSQPGVGASVRFRAMSPQEIASYGLPPGSSAQINDSTGAVQVLNKPSVAPNETAAERKSKLEAKVKLPRVSAAMRRADRLAQAVAAIGDNTFADGGPMDAKALQYTKDGREVLAASAQLMPELQALTRVPGIGSQSDLEARLASLALPSLEFGPETNARSMAELNAFIADLKAAYETIANGGATSTETPDEAGPAAVTAPTLSLDDIRKKYGR